VAPHRVLGAIGVTSGRYLASQPGEDGLSSRPPCVYRRRLDRIGISNSGCWRSACEAACEAICMGGSAAGQRYRPIRAARRALRGQGGVAPRRGEARDRSPTGPAEAIGVRL